jgi:hypothetical protein
MALLAAPCDLPELCREHVSVVVVRPLVLPGRRGKEVVVSTSVGKCSGGVALMRGTGCPILSAESAGIRTDRFPDGMFDPGDLTVTSY